MKIAVIGTGNVGGTLGRRWAATGHHVIFGTRDPSSDKVASLLEATGANARAASLAEAVAEVDVVVLATPWKVALEAVEKLDLSGKTVIDCTNPIAPGLKLAVGTTTSGAEQIAARATGASVVKAFNTTGAENMADPVYHGQATTMFICGDDPEAKATVSLLSDELGFETFDTGELSMARNLEPFALVWINLAMVRGHGRNIALRLVSR